MSLVEIIISTLHLIIYCSSESSLIDGRVYNYYFYVNTNSDIVSSGIYTESEAENHWLSYGINIGLQACGSFHVLQFLDNYPSLKQKYGKNYTAAIEYYLSIGYDSNLMGFTPGGAYNRYTIAEIATHLFLSTSKRMAGAIDSIVFKNVEYINAWNHGRNMQISIYINNNGPCFKPNEAGSINDAQSNISTSILTNISSDNNSLITSNIASFWLSSNDECAINTKNISMFNINKNIEIKYGYQGIWWITYKVDIFIPMDVDELMIESPVLYTNNFLNTFWSEDTNGGVYPINIDNDIGGNYTGNSKFNLIVSSNDSNMAITLVPSNMEQSSLQFKLENYLGLQPELNATVKLSALQTYRNVTKNTILSLETFICVGTVMDVQFCEGFAH